MLSALRLRTPGLAYQPSSVHKLAAAARHTMRPSMRDSAEDLQLLGLQTGKPGHAGKLGLHERTGKRSPRHLKVNAAAISSMPGEGDGIRRNWNSTTERLVALSTLPFLFLLLPQFVKNVINMSNGKAAALMALSWVGYLTGLGGNTLLLSYFSAKRESSAVLVQAIGIASSFAVLTQIRAAGFMPGSIYTAIAAVVAITATLTGLKLSGRMDATKAGQWVWAAWQKVLSLAGLAVVPQVLCSTIGGTSWLPSLITLSGGCVLLALEGASAIPDSHENVWGSLSAWTATLLFMLQPVAQLVSNFSDPGSLEGLSLATIVLGAAGNALMVPRALYTRDAVWLLGSTWGSLVFGWGQMLSMWLAQAPPTQQRFVSTPVFAACSLLLWAWFAYVLMRDLHAQGLAPQEALQQLLGAGRPAKRTRRQNE